MRQVADKGYHFLKECVMAKHRRELAQELNAKLQSLEYTRVRIERLYAESHIAQRDKKHVYEGLFLKAYVQFESFIENLFFGLIVSNSAIHTPSTIVPLVKINSHAVARKLAMGDKNYLDWLPYSNMKKHTEKLLRGGKPFSSLSSNQKQDLVTLSVIRNAIAHESDHSIEQFHAKVATSSTLKPSERRPSGFLMGIYRANPSETRYQLYASKMSQIAFHLVK